MRVSTGEQTADNQRRELEAAAASRGWSVVAVYADEGISGAKGREGRPQLDLMLKDAVRRRFDVAMVWAVDRLGRSLADLIGTLRTERAVRAGCLVGVVDLRQATQQR
jgi:DNA invertase Pin-like site-specific DNA recombinase